MEIPVVPIGEDPDTISIAYPDMITATIISDGSIEFIPDMLRLSLIEDEDKSPDFVMKLKVINLGSTDDFIIYGGSPIKDKPPYFKMGILIPYITIKLPRLEGSHWGVMKDIEIYIYCSDELMSYIDRGVTNIKNVENILPKETGFYWLSKSKSDDRLRIGYWDSIRKEWAVFHAINDVAYTTFNHKDLISMYTVESKTELFPKK